MKTALIFSLAALILSLGCSQPRNIFGQLSTPYHDLERQLTKEARLYGLEKVHYQTSITYKSKAFRRAYVDEYARRYRLADTEREVMLKKELEEAEKFHVFFVSHYATDKDSSRITKDEKTWRLSLNSEKPDSVLAVSSKDSVLQYFYPQITAWSQSYNVLFKNSGELRTFQVLLSGVDGNLEFNWDLKEDQL